MILLSYKITRPYDRQNCEDVMNTTHQRAKERYRILEWIDAFADKDGKVLLRSDTFESDGVDSFMIAVWLDELQKKGIIEITGRTKNDWYSLNIKNPDFHKYVDEVYRRLHFSVDELSTNNFLAVLDVTYDLHQRFEVTQSNTVTVGDTANIKKFPQLNDDHINYRSGAIQFLQEYGVINELEHDGVTFYKVTVTRRYFDRVYKIVLTRAIQEGYATYKGDDAATKPTGDRQVPAPIVEPKEPGKQPVESRSKKIEVHQLSPRHYINRSGVLWLSATDKVAIAKKGKVKRKNGDKYEECWLLECLFKSVNSLNRGVKISAMYRLHPDKIDEKKVSKVRNYIYEIDKKIIDEGGPKRLIFIQDKTVKLDKSYL